MLASSVHTAQTIGFGLIAAVMVLCAINVVASKNVVRAALSLVLVMAGAAAQYILLAAEFVAVTQVLVYIGAVMVLILFGVMLTRAKLGVELDLDNRNAAIAAPVALLLFGLLAFVLAKGFGSTELPNTSGTVPTQQSTSAKIGRAHV